MKVTCPRCDHPEMRKCVTGDCVHCDACDYALVPGSHCARCGRLLGWNEDRTTITCTARVLCEKRREKLRANYNASKGRN